MISLNSVLDPVNARVLHCGGSGHVVTIAVPFACDLRLAKSRAAPAV
jgi:hypothetical protein